MTPARQQQLLEGQSATARKVFDQVPIQEPWSSQQIHYHVGGDLTRTQGCLRSLKEQGLIKEVSRMRFQRTAVSAPKLGDVLGEALSQRQPYLEQKEAAEVAEKPAAAPADPVAELARLTEALRKAAQAHMEATVALADHIDEVAVGLMHHQETSETQLKEAQEAAQTLQTLKRLLAAS